eukprot:gene3101-2083_t
MSYFGVYLVDVTIFCMVAVWDVHVGYAVVSLDSLDLLVWLDAGVVLRSLVYDRYLLLTGVLAFMGCEYICYYFGGLQVVSLQKEGLVVTLRELWCLQGVLLCYCVIDYDSMFLRCVSLAWTLIICDVLFGYVSTCFVGFVCVIFVASGLGRGEFNTYLLYLHWMVMLIIKDCAAYSVLVGYTVLLLYNVECDTFACFVGRNDIVVFHLCVVVFGLRFVGAWVCIRESNLVVSVVDRFFETLVFGVFGWCATYFVMSLLRFGPGVCCDCDLPFMPFEVNCLLIRLVRVVLVFPYLALDDFVLVRTGSCVLTRLIETD